MELSRNDRRLIAALQRNARQSISDLSRELDLSRTTVQKRCLLYTSDAADDAMNV